MLKILPGDTFSKLTIVKELPRVQCGKISRRMFLCKCSCGKFAEMLIGNITSGASKSCGCTKTRHGLRHTDTYQIWTHLKHRCSNQNSTVYKNYGGRGISFDPRWSKFENFIEDMGLRPSKELSIDRIDNDGDYCKDNCRWTTMDVQANNRRPRSRRIAA
jgi:hypothetical protein